MSTPDCTNPAENTTETAEIPTNVAQFLALTKEEELNFSPSLAFLLQMPQYMQEEMENNGFDVCSRLKELCQQRGIEDAGSAEFCRAIDRHIRTHAIAPISLSLKTFVVADSKETAITRYNKARHEWGLHLPLFFQTTGKGYSDSLFFIFRAWEDGVDHLHRLLLWGSYPYGGKQHPCVQAVEQCLEVPCYGLYDFEIYLSGFKGRIAEARFWSAKESVPMEISDAFIRAGVMNPETAIQFTEKDKNREVLTKSNDVDQKNSSHFVSSLWASKADHILAYNAMERVFRQTYPWLPKPTDPKSSNTKKVQEDKVYDFVPSAVLADPDTAIGHIGLDRKAIPGGPNGFVISLSLNNGGAPSYPRLVGRITVRGNTVIRYTGQTPPPPHNVFTLSKQDCLNILRETLYTVPRFSMTFFDNILDKRREQELLECTMKATLAAKQLENKTNAQASLQESHEFIFHLANI